MATQSPPATGGGSGSGSSSGSSYVLAAAA